MRAKLMKKDWSLAGLFWCWCMYKISLEYMLLLGLMVLEEESTIFFSSYHSRPFSVALFLPECNVSTYYNVKILAFIVLLVNRNFVL
jgi:hypothetical protein